MNAFLQVAIRFGVIGIVTAGVVLVTTYLNNRRLENEHTANNNTNVSDEPMIINMATQCAICWENFDENAEQMKDRRCLLPRCGHQFHNGCIRQLVSPSCPICRVQFSL